MCVSRFERGVFAVQLAQVLSAARQTGGIVDQKASATGLATTNKFAFSLLELLYDRTAIARIAGGHFVILSFPS